MKQCKKCGKVKPLADFNKNSRNPDGKYHQCRACAAEVRNDYIRNPRREKTVQERFEQRTIPVTESGCWIWTGQTVRGYGRFKYGDSIQAHRVSWELYKGPIPDGLHVLHKCDVPSCVNPQHLFLGTNQDNVDDRVMKGRQLRGTKLTWSKLTDEAVLVIREEHGKTSVKELAKRFNVCITAVRQVIQGKTWRHVMSG